MEPSQGWDGLQAGPHSHPGRSGRIRLASGMEYRVFLQGSYQYDTNVGGDSDVDVVVRLASRLRPRVADLSGKALQVDGSHKLR